MTMTLAVPIERYIQGVADAPFAQHRAATPWWLTTNAEAVVRAILPQLGDGYRVDGDIAIHHTATIEAGATLKGPLVIGPRNFIANGAYLRGGCWLDADVIIGPGAELKTSFVFAGTKLAHFNFVGDSVLGARVNLEAGSIVCNYRNERADKEIRVRVDGTLHMTGVTKFGALIGDDGRVGANAVLAPGALLAPASVVTRTALVDQEREQAL
jgi:UDP-N-acetylglucosamine diphosphorylase / glucose-1-phosphate thymidylyltransferase / UDP-N-acetylgalactosamine diphosphorylase / glucosamine-1-phosphate N-acetyltransferase / galactosamine-1-phosphate N-acetyltransferase